MKYTLQVSLNGTKINPFHKYGIKQNPFPQLGKAQWAEAERRVAQLGGNPLRDTDQIREILKGFDQTFVNLCCFHFKKGEYIRFAVEWTESDGNLDDAIAKETAGTSRMRRIKRQQEGK
jgi:hypothetical protein